MARKVALALGGGGAKFFTHLGMISVLQENDIQIDYISSSSMGAIAASLIANDVPIETIKKEFYKWKNFWSWVTPTISRYGLMSQNGITDILSRLLPQKNIEDSKIPFSVTSANILDGKLHLFEKGDIVLAVRASCAFPGVFPPIEIDDKMLVDGGVLNNIPADICRKKVGKKGIVISSSVDAKLKCNRADISGPIDVYQRVVYLPMYEKRHKTINAHSDFFLEHFADKTLSISSSRDIFKVLDKKALEEFYQLGRENTLKIIDDIKKAVNS